MVDQRSLDHTAVFRSMPSAALVMDLDLRILDANPAYLRATNRALEDLVGRHVFDAFPQSPLDPDGDGVQNLRASLQHVMQMREPHHMWVQRYDVPWDGEPEGFVERYWSPVNTPIMDGSGELVGILHVVEDVTGLHDDLVAALEFYRAEIRSQGESDEDRDRRFTEYARLAMSNARTYDNVVTEVSQLREALTSRATIDQAKGILMAQRRCGPDAAFQMLVRSSQSNNIKVRDLAARLIAHVTRAGPANPG
jgi:PAS domain S-box-containing protein